MKVAVFGGAGFLGRRICVQALNAGHQVVSFSRSGRAPADLSYSAQAQIKWQAADVFDPKTYEDQLGSVDAVVHSMGLIIADERYKKVLSGSVDPSALAGMAWAAVSSANPMQRDAQDPFERMNCQSAVQLAQTVAQTVAKAKPFKTPFVYISADDWNPLADRRYINSKRRAEVYLSSAPNIRPVLVRPAFMAANPQTLDVRTVLGAGLNLLNRGLGRPSPVLHVDTVARAVVESLVDESVSGVVSLEALQAYAA